MEGSHSVTISQKFISSHNIKGEDKNISDLWGRSKLMFHALFYGKLLQGVLPQNKHIN